jgi:hypothetical protein
MIPEIVEEYWLVLVSFFLGMAIATAMILVRLSLGT